MKTMEIVKLLKEVDEAEPAIQEVIYLTLDRKFGGKEITEDVGQTKLPVLKKKHPDKEVLSVSTKCTGKKKKYSDEQIMVVVELWQQKKQMVEISNLTGIKKGSLSTTYLNSRLKEMGKEIVLEPYHHRKQSEQITEIELENLKALFTLWLGKWDVPFVLVKKCKREYEEISGIKSDAEIAKELGVSYQTLYYRLEKLGIKK